MLECVPGANGRKVAPCGGRLGTFVHASGEEDDSLAEIRTGIQEVDPRHALDVARLEAHLRTHLDGFEGPLRVRQFVGGQSNPTYHLGDGHREWVLRRKPPGRLVASAHAVDREFRVLSALSRVGFPVPRPRFHCTDESVIGTEFYVMDRIEGRILVDQTLPGWTPEERRSLYASQIGILARLHGYDPAELGLADYGSPGTTSRARSTSGASSMRAPTGFRARRWSG